MLTDVAIVAILLPAELIAELPAELPQYHVRHRKKKTASGIFHGTTCPDARILSRMYLFRLSGHSKPCLDTFHIDRQSPLPRREDTLKLSPARAYSALSAS